MVSTRLLGAVIIVVFIADVFLAAYPMSIGSTPIESPGVTVQGSWLIPSSVEKGSWLWAALRTLSMSTLLIPTPIPSDFQAANKMLLDFNQFEEVLVDLQEHSAYLPSADQAREQAIVNNIVKPVLDAYSPAKMVDYLWKTKVGVTATGQLGNGTLTLVDGETFTSIEQFSAAVTKNNAFAQAVAETENWGWTQTCPDGAPCSGGENNMIFVPASRYWSPTVLSLVIQVGAQEGKTQAQILNELLSQGYTPGLVYDSLLKANSMSGTVYNYYSATTSRPDGVVMPFALESEHVTFPRTGVFGTGLDPTIYGTRPVVLSSGMPEPSIITDGHGNFWALTGSLQFTGWSAKFEQQALEKGCPTAGCTAEENFAAVVGRNGGYSAVQGGYVDKYPIPVEILQNFGNNLIASNPQYAGQDPLQLAYSESISLNMFSYMINMGFPVSDNKYVCARGCVSPIGYNRLMTPVTGTLDNFQKAVQQYEEKYSTEVFFDQPAMESGVVPGFGNGAVKTTPTDAVYNAALTGRIGNTKLSVEEIDAIIKGQSTTGVDTVALSKEAYAYRMLGWYKDYGWTVVIPKGVLDPNCSGQLCTSKMPEDMKAKLGLTGVPDAAWAGNLYGDGTHYIISKDFAYTINQLLTSTDPKIQAILKSYGITDYKSAENFFNHPIDVFNELDAGQPTAGSALAVAQVSDVFSRFAQYDPRFASITDADIQRVFSMTPEDFKSYWSYQSAAPHPDPVIEMLNKIPFGVQGGGSGFMSLGQLFEQHPNLYTYGSELIRDIRNACSNHCSYSERAFIIRDWMTQHGLTPLPWTGGGFLTGPTNLVGDPPVPGPTRINVFGSGLAHQSTSLSCISLITLGFCGVVVTTTETPSTTTPYQGAYGTFSSSAAETQFASNWNKEYGSYTYSGAGVEITAPEPITHPGLSLIAVSYYPDSGMLRIHGTTRLRVRLRPLSAFSLIDDVTGFLPGLNLGGVIISWLWVPVLFLAVLFIVRNRPVQLRLRKRI